MMSVEGRCVIVVALSEQQLAARAGATVEDIRRLVRLGIVDAGEGEVSYPDTLVPRVRLALHLELSGISLEDVGQAVSTGRLSLAFADRLFGRPIGMLDMSPLESLEELSMSEEFFAEVQTTLGIPGDDGLLREDDAELLRLLDAQLGLGLKEPVLARFFQIVVDNLRKIAQGGREMWIAGVEEPLLAQGLSHAELLEAEAGPAPESQLLGEAMIQVLWNRCIEQEIFQAAVEHLETTLEEAGVARKSGTSDPAIMFLDLTGYTNLTERTGDEAAAEHAQGLLDLLRPLSAQHRGRLVKMLGDGAMLHFLDPNDAVRCGLALVEAVPAAGMPAARVALNAGPLILRDADFYGRTVNIAARLVDYARPKEVLVTETVVRTSNTQDIRYKEIGPVSLKGVPDPVTVYAAALP